MKPWRLRGRRGFTRHPENSNVHISGPRRFIHHQNSTKGPQERERRMKIVTGGGKKETEQTPFVRLQPINFDFGQFRLRPISTSTSWPKSNCPEVELAEVEHPRNASHWRSCERGRNPLTTRFLEHDPLIMNFKHASREQLRQRNLEHACGEGRRSQLEEQGIKVLGALVGHRDFMRNIWKEFWSNMLLNDIPSPDSRRGSFTVRQLEQTSCQSCNQSVFWSLPGLMTRTCGEDCA